MARSRSATGALITALGLACVACQLGGAFVGSSPQLRGGSSVTRRVGVDYLLRNGPKDADPPLMDVTSASGATHEIEFKKYLGSRPCLLSPNHLRHASHVEGC